MPIYKSKHPTQQTISFTNLLGGLYLAGNAESIPNNCLSRADNFEYGNEITQLQTVPGLVPMIDFGSNVDTVFYDRLHASYLASSGTSLYKTDLYTKTLIGTLTGTARPTYCFFDTFVLIASGGQIQKWNGTTLSTISGSPNSHVVSFRRGRIRAYNIVSDVVNYSGVGDCTQWTNNPADLSTAQYYDVGYKDASNIACIMELSTDLIVIKTSGVAYRVESETNWASVSIVEAAQKAYAYNQFSGVAVLNRAYFIGQEGFNSFGTTLNYGAVLMDEPSPGIAVNPAIIANVSSASEVWHVTPKKQIWVKCQNDSTIYIYHYLLNAWTRRILTNQINDVTFNGHDVYVAAGNKIFHADSSIATDDGAAIYQLMTTKRLIPQRLALLVKQMVLDTYTLNGGVGTISVPSDGSKIVYPITFSPGGVDAYSDNSDAYSNNSSGYDTSFKHNFIRRCARIPGVDISVLITSGSVAIRNLSIDIVEV